MTAAGTWNLTIDTLLGRQHAIIELAEVGNGLRGTATDVRSGETVPLTDLTIDGAHVTWRQSITKPMRLNLTFDVAIDNDTLSGTARPGRLPGSAVTGRRIPDGRGATVDPPVDQP